MTKIKKTSLKVLNLFLVAVFLLASGFGCSFQSSQQAAAIKPVTLNYWRVFDDQDAFDQIIRDYQAIHPNVTINYRKFRYEEFEPELLNALAEDRGPDIFSIPEPLLKKYESKLMPMPASLQLGYIVEKNYFGIKKEQVVEIRNDKTPTLRELKDKYADTVYSDVVINNQVYGLPLSLDTLVMYYNKDILNQAGIAQVPTDWKSFQEAVIKTTKFETENVILQSGTALGTGYNVERVFDILSVLMLQNGANMTNAQGYPTFFSNISIGNKTVNPGLTALQFYADFALPLKQVYSWSNTMANSLTSFMAGKVGFFFGYNYQLAQIRSQSRVNFGIAALPQITGNPVKNYANYWLEVVSKKSKNQNEAWDFILFANKPAEVAKYLAQTNRPTAQKALIASQQDNEDLHASVGQILTAETWYRGQDVSAAEVAFKELAERYLLVTNSNEINNVISVATQKISQTINAQ